MGITNPDDKDLHVKASNCLCMFVLVPGSIFCLTGCTSFLSIPEVLSLSEMKGQRMPHQDQEKKLDSSFESFLFLPEVPSVI